MVKRVYAWGGLAAFLLFGHGVEQRSAAPPVKVARAITKALLANNIAQAQGFLSASFPEESFGGSKAENREVARILREVTRGLYHNVFDEASRSRVSSSMSAFLDSLLLTRFAAGAKYAASRGWFAELAARQSAQEMASTELQKEWRAGAVRREGARAMATALLQGDIANAREILSAALPEESGGDAGELEPGAEALVGLSEEDGEATDLASDEALLASTARHRRIGSLIAKAARLADRQAEDEAAKARLNASLAEFIDALVLTGFADAAMFAASRRTLADMAILPSLRRSIATCRAIRAHLDRNVAELGEALRQRAEQGPEDDLGRLLRLILLKSEAEHHPYRNQELRTEAEVLADDLALPDPLPPIILGEVVAACTWIGGRALDRLLDGPDAARLAATAPEAVAAASTCRRLLQAKARGDLAAALAAVHKLEQMEAALPAHECAEILLAVSKEEADGAALDQFFASVRLDRRSRFLMAVAVLHCISTNNHRWANDALNTVFEDYLGLLRSGKYAAVREGVLFYSGLVRWLIGDVRSKTLTALPAARFMDDWDEAVRHGLSSAQISQPDRQRLIDLQVCLATMYGDLADPKRIAANFEFALTLPEVRDDLGALERLIPLIWAAARRPDYPLLRRMTEGLREAVEAQYPTLDSFLQYITSSEAGAHTRLRTVVAVFDYLGRFEEMLLICKGSEAAQIGPEVDLRVGRSLLWTSDRRTSLTGLEKLEALHREGELRRPADRSTLVCGKLRLGKAKEAEHLVRDGGELDEIAEHLSPKDAVLLAKLVAGSAAAESLASRGLQQAATRFCSRFSPGDLNAMIAYERLRNEEEFLQETNGYLNSVPQPSQPKGVIAVLASNDGDLRAMPVLSFLELKKRGHAVISLHAGQIDGGPTAVAELNELDGAMAGSGRESRWTAVPCEWLNEWEIDLPRRKAVCRGVNFYQGVEEYLCCLYRRFTVDYDCHPTTLVAMETLRRMDNIISCVDRMKAIARTTGVPIRVFCVAPHLGVEYAARAYINKVSEDGDIELFQSMSAYENYYTNFSTEYGTSLAVRSLTRYPYLTNATTPPVEDFERWYAQEWDPVSTRDGIVDKLVRTNRVQKDQSTDGAASVRQRALAERQQGRTIVCLLGKVVFDQGVPLAGGPAHRDMKDWFDHTVAIARCNRDLLLLIKPHPHELREEIALYPSEVLQHWVPSDAPDNILFLPHNMFNLHEVAEFIDLALIWHGSAAMELGVLGVPCVVAGIYGALDYPVKHTMPRDRKHYEWLLDNPSKVAASPETADRCRALLTYFKTEHLSTPYRYTLRPLTNKKAKRLEWFREDVERYQREGDPFVTLLADRIEGKGLIGTDPGLDWTDMKSLFAFAPKAADTTEIGMPVAEPTAKSMVRITG